MSVLVAPDITDPSYENATGNYPIGPAILTPANTLGAPDAFPENPVAISVKLCIIHFIFLS